MPYVRRRRTTTKKPKRAPRRTIRRTPASNIRAIVKKTITRMAEKKTTAFPSKNYAFNGGTQGFGSTHGLGQALNLNQGTGQADRIGNKINVTKAMMSYNLRTIDGTLDLPAEVHIFIGYIKGDRDTSWQAAFNTETFNNGNSVVPWDGTYITSLRSLNTDKFVIKHHIIKKIGCSFTNTAYSQNNEYKLTHRGKINLKSLLGPCTFLDDDAGNSHNKDLWMSASWLYSNEAVGDAISFPVPPVKFDYFIDVEFTDL